jgi:hypothetical protein
LLDAGIEFHSLLHLVIVGTGGSAITIRRHIEIA